MVMKDRAVEAWRILNAFVGELIAGTRSVELYESSGFKRGATPNVLRECVKMSISYLFITLTKWAEFYEKYHQVIPKEVRPACRELKKEIERRGIVRFRNHVIGHIWSKKHKRPLGKEEVEQSLRQVLGDDENAFFLWVNNPSVLVKREMD